MATTPRQPSSVDEAEIARFSALAETWWDPEGSMRPLHRLNPTRLAWSKRQMAAHFSRDPQAPDALHGLSILDVGCGAGILSEPLARMGAEVVGIDPSEEAAAAARLHAEESGLTIDYRSATAEDLAAAGERFDVVAAMEVVEHVTDLRPFIETCAALVKPGGMVLLSTINRTAKAFLLAIVAAEYVLRWLPRGTHSYDKLVTPAELAAALGEAGLEITGETGVAYAPFANEWRLTGDMDVNYMIAAAKPR